MLLNIRFLFLRIIYRSFHLDPFDLEKGKIHKAKICNPTTNEKRTSTIKCELVSYKPPFEETWQTINFYTPRR